MSFEPTEGMKAAYRFVRDRHFADDLADLAQHATAAALEAEFWLEHPLVKGERKKHDFTPADWLRLADKELREVKP